jgi:hypothetical protein
MIIRYQFLMGFAELQEVVLCLDLRQLLENDQIFLGHLSREEFRIPVHDNKINI